METIDSRSALLDRLTACRSELRRLGVVRLGVFGSFARDEVTNASDVDVLVTFDPTRKTYENYLGVVRLLESVLNRSVEVITPEALSPYIGPRIQDDLLDVEI